MRIGLLGQTQEHDKGLHGGKPLPQKILFYLNIVLCQEEISMVALELSGKTLIQTHAFFPLGNDWIQRLSPSKQECVR